MHSIFLPGIFHKKFVLWGIQEDPVTQHRGTRLMKGGCSCARMCWQVLPLPSLTVRDSDTPAPEGARLCSVTSSTTRLYFIFHAVFYIMLVAPKLNCTWLIMESRESVAVTGRCVIPTTEMHPKAQGIMAVKSLVLQNISVF